MSWQAYVDTSLVGSGHIHKAAIISRAGDSVWATSADFTLATDEMKTISNILKDEKGDAANKAYGEGIQVAGDKYVVNKIDDGTIYGKGKPENEAGNKGIIIAKTQQAILVGYYGQGIQPGNASQTIGALADYLKKQGY